MGSDLVSCIDAGRSPVTASRSEIPSLLNNTLRHTLDSEGNRLKEETLDPSGTVKRIASFEYDALSRQVKPKDAQNRATSLTLDIYGNLKTATDALNRVSSNSYDDLDRLTQTVSDVGGIAATVSFGYDAAGNLIRVTDPKALHTDYTYDTANRLKQLSSPDTVQRHPVSRVKATPGFAHPEVRVEG
jgi:YD repeat-containing protein